MIKYLRRCDRVGYAERTSIADRKSGERIVANQVGIAADRDEQTDFGVLPRGAGRDRARNREASARSAARVGVDRAGNRFGLRL